MTLKWKRANKTEQQTNGNRAILLVYRTDTNTSAFWLVKRTLGWKNFMPENFLETCQPILRYDVILQHDWPIEQCLFHIRVFFGGKTKRPWSFHPLAVKTNIEHLPKPFFKVMKIALPKEILLLVFDKLLGACLDLRWSTPHFLCISSISETLLFVFVILLPSVWISLRYNHFFSRLTYYLSIVGYPSPVISQCLDTRWNTPSRVWYITPRNSCNSSSP